MGETARCYAGVRARVTELALGFGDGSIPVPTCPGWSVRDVVAHLTGVVSDVLGGRIEGLATEPWTAAQIEARRDASIDELVAEWESGSPRFEELIDSIGDRGCQAVADAVTHEHDIRTALGRPGARDSDAVVMGFEFVGRGLVASAGTHGLNVRLDGAGATAQGPPDAELVVRGTAFELLRVSTGRRSLEQIRALDWNGDCEPVLGAFSFGPFAPSLVAIEE